MRAVSWNVLEEAEKTGFHCADIVPEKEPSSREADQYLVSAETTFFLSSPSQSVRGQN